MVRIIGNCRQQDETVIAMSSSTTFALTGPPHVGKRTFLSIQAKERFDERDVLFVGGTVKDAREASDFFRFMPIIETHRLVVVDCCNGISDAAQDAYLKPCEELPSSASIAFVLNNESHVSEPLRSRFRNVIRWDPLDVREMDDFLHESGDSDDVVRAACMGRPGLYDALAQVDIARLRNSMMTKDAVVSSVPPDVKDVPPGTSLARDALCSVLYMVAKELAVQGNVLRARKAMILASTLCRVPSTNVEVHWRHAWTVPDVT